MRRKILSSSIQIRKLPAVHTYSHSSFECPEAAFQGHSTVRDALAAVWSNPLSLMRKAVGKRSTYLKRHIGMMRYSPNHYLVSVFKLF